MKGCASARNERARRTDGRGDRSGRMSIFSRRSIERAGREEDMGYDDDDDFCWVCS